MARSAAEVHGAQKRVLLGAIGDGAREVNGDPHVAKVVDVHAAPELQVLDLRKNGVVHFTLALWICGRRARGFRVSFSERWREFQKKGHES